MALRNLLWLTLLWTRGLESRLKYSVISERQSALRRKGMHVYLPVGNGGPVDLSF